MRVTKDLQLNVGFTFGVKLKCVNCGSYLDMQISSVISSEGEPTTISVQPCEGCIKKEATNRVRKDYSTLI